MSKLPALNEKMTITKLFDGSIDAVPLEHLNVILSTPPPSDWVKTHPYIKGYQYLPIDKVEYLLKRCFKKYQIEVRKTGQLLNAIEVNVRVHYLNPATNEMMYHDGVGAQELQTQAGTGNLKLDMSNVNRGAVTMALPIAKSVAIKDACDHFGDLFGANLNRKDTIQFLGDSQLLSTIGIDELKELFELKRNVISSNDLPNYERIINNQETDKYKYMFNQLKSIQ